MVNSQPAVSIIALANNQSKKLSGLVLNHVVVYTEDVTAVHVKEGYRNKTIVVNSSQLSPILRPRTHRQYSFGYLSVQHNLFFCGGGGGRRTSIHEVVGGGITTNKAGEKGLKNMSQVY